MAIVELPIRTVRGACPHDCPDTCAWTVTVQDGRAVELKGDPDHPFTRGGLCTKVNHFLEDRTYNSDRLLQPLRRSGPKGSGAFEPVTWDQALDDIAARLKAIVAESGAEAVMPYSYMGTQGLLQGSAMSDPFFARLGATHLVRAVCGGAGLAGLNMTMGGGPGFLPEELAHSRHIILWGTNTISTNLHLWPFIREAKQHGATVVVIDPSKTRTAVSRGPPHPSDARDRRRAGHGHDERDRGRGSARQGLPGSVHRRVREAERAAARVHARTRRTDHARRRRRDPRPGARVRDHAPVRDPDARGHGAPRERRRRVPRRELPTGGDRARGASAAAVCPT